MIGQTIGHYQVLSSLGQGGMGEVYLAEDGRLGRRVALKFLSPSFINDPDRLRRFEQEARAASALNQPNILTIYEIGESDGQRFIATEYIEGDRLRQRMLMGSLTLIGALTVAEQIASALAAAHAAGIIHRDIKPENVMLRSDGIAKVLDFGLAKLTEEKPAGPEDSTRAMIKTGAGLVMGTAAYMSPEQARGLEIDARTDVWSLGCVLYEMIAGRAAFAGPTTSDTIVNVLEREPASLAKHPASVPAELQRIVKKALFKDRDGRYQTIKDLLIDLKNLRRSLEFEGDVRQTLSAETGREIPGDLQATRTTSPQESTIVIATQPTSSVDHFVSGLKRHKLAAIVLLALFLTGILGLLAYQRTTTDEAIDSIAVLPFVNETKDPNTEYLSDGISDSIINRLSQLSNLRVASLSSALHYKGQLIDPLAVGRDLKVRAVLIGWMTKRGDNLSVRTELVDVRDNRRLWGAQYDNRQLADLLQVQEQISHEISEKLRLRLTGEDQKRLDKTETQNTEAYQLYLQGRFYWNKYTDEGFRKSIDFFKQAIEKDSNYALAYSGLADSYSLLGEQGAMPSSQAFPQARGYAEKALSLDDKLPNAHLSLGIVKLFYDWDVAGGEKELRRAKELDPNNPQVHHFYGHYLQWAGQLEEGRDEMQRGIELDPTNLIINAEFGFADYYLRRYDPAIAQLRKTLELDPNFVLASLWLAQAYEQKGMYQQALTELQRAKTIGDWSWITAEIGCVDAYLGKRAEALKTIKELTERRSAEYIDPGTVAYIYISLGDKDQSFAWLEKAYQERAGSVIPWMKFDPKFDSLRDDARFKDLLRRIGLPE